MKTLIVQQLLMFAGAYVVMLLLYGAIRRRMLREDKEILSRYNEKDWEKMPVEQDEFEIYKN